MADDPLPQYVRCYWGKARPADGAPAFHPLAYHSLDVAAALAALLDLRPGWLAAVATASNLSVVEVRKRLILAAAFHDIGKFGENFQAKVPDLHARLLPGAMVADDGRSHGEIGGGFWRRQKDPRFAAMATWMAASFAHHGAPVPETAGIANAMSPAAMADARTFVEATVAQFGSPAGAPPLAAAEVWRVAGLMILADWIGSNQTWFPYEPPVHALPAYWDLALARAKIALGEARLAEAPGAQQVDIGTLLGPEAQASPLQDWASRQRPGRHPLLYLLEDLTGAGKTEAALLLVYRLIMAGAAEGFYWALPSMATANGLYARLGPLYRRLFGDGGAVPSLVLAHSARDLNDGFQASIGRAQTRPYPGEGPDDVSAEAACAAFVADDRRKAFLAQVGVGTLDQALLAVLPNRHQALRLSALSRRVLIVDEAHSYDPYMTKALEQLLTFQRALGGSAIVLSATLTTTQRRRFAALYGGTVATAASMAFPLATASSAAGLVETSVPAARGTRRDLPVRRFETPEETMAALVAAARSGACCAYVRNTVKDAVAAYEHLVAMAGDDVQVDLFHARFALGDRLALENEALGRFGRSSGPDQRRGRILVATQVIEQSLDLDFDCLATDLCPIDLLIQRAGRLQRHDHRPGRPPAELWLVGPSATADADATWYARAFPAAAFVYADLGQLWRTMRVVELRGGLPLASASPRDLIEAVFGGDPIAAPPAIEAAGMSAEAKRQASRGIAAISVLRPEAFDRDAGRWDDPERTPTRLGDETRVLWLARWEEGKLQPWFAAEPPARAWRLSEIAVRAARVADTVPPDAAAATAIRAERQSWPGRFDPPLILALVPAGEAGVWQGAWQDGEGRRQAVLYSARRGLEIGKEKAG